MNIQKKDIGYFAKICCVLLIITMAVAFLLSFVNGLTKDVIAQNEKEKFNEAILELFPNAENAEFTKIESTEYDKELREFCKITKGDSLIGYYAKVSPVGFKGEVDILVGISVDGKTTGIKVLTCNETIGIGTLILEDNFTSKFKGLTGNISYKKGATGENGEMDGISGATYSSKAVIVGVNSALKAYETATK